MKAIIVTRKKLASIPFIFQTKYLQYVLLPRDRIYKRVISLGVDSEESIPSAYVAWRAVTTNRVSDRPARLGIDYLCFLKDLQIRTLVRANVRFHKLKILRGFAETPFGKTRSYRVLRSV
jgi:hypothetical protein